MWIDNVIGIFSPELGAKRLAWRSAMDKQRNYDGATRGRRGEGWYASAGSINQINGPALQSLRERSRWISRNFSYGKRAIETITTRTIGAGIKPAFSGPKATTTRVKSAWKSWAESTACDFDDRMTLYGLQKLAMRTVAESGEALIIKRYKKGDIPIQLQVLEPEFIDQSKDTGTGFQTKDGYVLQGVAYDKYGRKTGYWLFNRHPSEFGNMESELVPAEDVIHIFDVLRPGQVRGVPFGVSAFLTSRDFGDLQDARLMKEKVSASWAAFVQDLPNTDLTMSGANKTAALPDKIEPGAIEHLPPGKTITFPNTPTTEGYSDYSRTVKEGIAAGYGVTYASMTGDLTQVNFSSGKMGENAMQLLVEDWQLNMMIPQFCSKVFMWFQDAALISLGIPKTVTVSWTTPRKLMIDPVKEIKGIVESVRAGLDSWEEAVREAGWDPDELKEQLKQNAAMWDELKLMPSSDPRFDPTRQKDKPAEAKPKPTQ